MTTHEVKTVQVEGMTLKSILADGEVMLDVPVEEGGNGNGVKPKPLLLTSLTGCTALDVVSLLKKMKIEYDHFEVNASAELTDEHPKHYKSVSIEYLFKGNDLNKERIERAVDLSYNKYCGVIYMFKQFTEVSFKITYL
ncbi:MAG: OsmC family protein [Chitinophagales bacterium]